MPPTFEQAKDAIAQLVKHFATNHEAYRAPAYKEAHARQEFIDPFFVALGWDVHNAQRAAPDYREVVAARWTCCKRLEKSIELPLAISRGRLALVSVACCAYNGSRPMPASGAARSDPLADYNLGGLPN